MLVTLRPYQQQGVNEIRGAYQIGHTRVLYVLPTGGGKTVIFTHIAEQAAIKGNRICILVHRQELVDQSSRSLHDIGCNHGIISSGYRQDLSHTVQLASVQTLARRLHTIPSDFFALLVIDEAHHAVAGTWDKVIRHCSHAHILGVTATPERLDGRGLRSHFDTMILGPDAAWLTDQDFLVPALVYQPPGIDLSAIKRFDTKKGRQEASDRIRLSMGDPITHYRRTIADNYNGTALAFCVSVADADALAEAFRAQGIPAAMLDGTMDRGDRRRLISDLGAGVLKVLTSCEIISEGTDIPSVAGGIGLRPTDSLSLHLQQMGRILRPCLGKQVAVWNDHVGNTNCDRHGLPTDPREWSLDGRAKRKRAASEAAPYKICDRCFATLPTAVQTCPQCGFEFAPPPNRELITVEGDLQEAQGNAVAKRRMLVAQARTREELEAIAHAHGYKPGWVNHILAARAQRHAQRPF